MCLCPELLATKAQCSMIGAVAEVPSGRSGVTERIVLTIQKMEVGRRAELKAVRLEQRHKRKVLASQAWYRN